MDKLTDEQLETLEVSQEEFDELSADEQLELAKDKGIELEKPKGDDDDDDDDEGEKDKKIAGLYDDLKSERERRQALEGTVQSLTKSAEELKESIEDLKGKKDDEELQLNDDDVITVAQAKKMFEKQLNNIEDRLNDNDQTTAQQTIAQRFVSSEKEAKEKYTETSVGKDYAYETVMKAFKELVADKPYYKDVIRNSEDPAQEAYELTISLHKKYKGKTNQKVADTLLDNLNDPKKPKTGGASGGGASGDLPDDLTVDELLDMPADKLDELAKKV